MSVGAITQQLPSSLVTAATPQPATPPAPSAPAAPKDSVSLSPLAKSLKGDALTLFSSLEPKDRAALGALVDSGAMTAEEVGNALSDALKQTRGKLFWQQAQDAERATPGYEDRKAAGDAMTSTLQDAESLAEQLGRVRATKGARSADYARLKEQLSQVNDRIGTLHAQSQRVDRRNLIALPGTFAVTKLNRSDEERVAGEKLQATGFASQTFTAAVEAVAAQDVNAVISAQRAAQA